MNNETPTDESGPTQTVTDWAFIARLTWFVTVLFLISMAFTK